MSKREYLINYQQSENHDLSKVLLLVAALASCFMKRNLESSSRSREELFPFG